MFLLHKQFSMFNPQNYNGSPLYISKKSAQFRIIFVLKLRKNIRTGHKKQVLSLMEYHKMLLVICSNLQQAHTGNLLSLQNIKYFFRIFCCKNAKILKMPFFNFGPVDFLKSYIFEMWAVAAFMQYMPLIWTQISYLGRIQRSCGYSDSAKLKLGVS